MAEIQTTVRLDADLKASVDALRKVQKTTLNRLMNDALAHYVRHLAIQKLSALEQTLAAVDAYNARDPDHKEAISRVVAAELAGRSDPMEGTVIMKDPKTEGEEPGETETKILGILNG